jgi:hypothetical protein
VIIAIAWFICFGVLSVCATLGNAPLGSIPSIERQRSKETKIKIKRISKR